MVIHLLFIQWTAVSYIVDSPSLNSSLSASPHSLSDFIITALSLGRCPSWLLTYLLSVTFSIIRPKQWRRHTLCSFKSKILSYFTPKKLAAAAERFQMEHAWKDEFEVTGGHKNAHTYLWTYSYRDTYTYKFYVFYLVYAGETRVCVHTHEHTYMKSTFTDHDFIWLSE